MAATGMQLETIVPSAERQKEEDGRGAASHVWGLKHDTGERTHEPGTDSQTETRGCQGVGGGTGSLGLAEAKCYKQDGYAAGPCCAEQGTVSIP